MCIATKNLNIHYPLTVAIAAMLESVFELTPASVDIEETGAADIPI